MPHVRRARVSINLDALEHNLQQAKNAAPRSKVMAVIKANAYGHGMLRVAEALADADGFAVATIDEGLALRTAGVSKPLLILEGASNLTEFQLAAEQKLTLSMHHESQLQSIAQYTGQFPPLWLKLDSGMHRLGFPVEQAERLLSQLSSHLTGIMTHFANADDPENPANRKQLDAFSSATESSHLTRSAANSAALLTLPDSQFDWVRPGIMLYGSSPLLDVPASKLNLKPVMTLTAPLIAINHLKQGEAVGYGGAYVCPRDMLVGVIAIGYGDGYPRHAPSGTPVLIGDKECTLAGRVSMDMLTVDLTHCPDAKIGDDATLWGEGISVDRIAEYASTIGYELLCAAGRYNTP